MQFTKLPCPTLTRVSLRVLGVLGDMVWTLEFRALPTNVANQVKLCHDLVRSRSPIARTWVYTQTMTFSDDRRRQIPDCRDRFVWGNSLYLFYMCYKTAILNVFFDMYLNKISWMCQRPCTLVLAYSIMNLITEFRMKTMPCILSFYLNVFQS